MTPQDKTVRLTRTLAVASLLALIALALAWELWLAPLRPGGSWLALKALPLCLPLAGLLKNRMYTYRWLSLLVWLYFTEGVVRAWSDPPPGTWLALLEVLLCLVLFAACALHVRLRLKYAKARADSGRILPPPRHERTAGRAAAHHGRRPCVHRRRPERLHPGLAQARAWQGAGRGAPRQHRRSGGHRQGLRVAPGRDQRQPRAAGRQHRPGGGLGAR